MDDERLDAAALVGLVDTDWDDDDLKDYQLRNRKQRSRLYGKVAERRVRSRIL